MTVSDRVSRLTLVELALLADTLPASLRPPVSRLPLFRLTAVTSPPAAVSSRGATGRLRPRATDTGEVAEEDAPADVPPVMSDAFTESVLAIATHLINRARDPPVPPPGPATVAAPESMSPRPKITWLAG